MVNNIFGIHILKDKSVLQSYYKRNQMKLLKSISVETNNLEVRWIKDLNVIKMKY